MTWACTLFQWFPPLRLGLYVTVCCRQHTKLSCTVLHLWLYLPRIYHKDLWWIPHFLTYEKITYTISELTLYTRILPLKQSGIVLFFLFPKNTLGKCYGFNSHIMSTNSLVRFNRTRSLLLPSEKSACKYTTGTSKIATSLPS